MRHGMDAMGSAKIALTLILLQPLALEALFSQEAGERVSRSGVIKDDYYGAGGEVNVDGTADGDLLLAGGEVRVSGTVVGDVMAAGGEVRIKGDMRDDVRAAGGRVEVDAIIGDDLAAAGGSVRFSRDSSTGGRLFLAGGEVNMEGNARGDLKAAGGVIRISGRVKGDAELWGDRIILERGSIIDGDLVYHSMKEAQISDGASIKGTVIFDRMERDTGRGIASMILGWSMLLFAGIALHFLFPTFTARSSIHIKEAAWQSLGFGFAVTVMVPVLILVSMVTVVGLWIGLVLLALYPVLLLGGYLTGLFSIGDLAAGWFKQETEKRPFTRLLFFSLALATFGLVWIVPIIGALINALVLLAGTGSLSLNIRRVYSGGD